MDAHEKAFKKAAKILSDNSSFLICIVENATDDSIASATSLYIALSKLGKDATMVCASEINSDLIASDKIKDELNIRGDVTIISFPFKEEAYDKIHCDIQGDKFNIVIKPSSPKYKLDPKKVKFSSSGGKVDYVITIDADSLRKLGYVYSENQNLFENKKIINIDRHITNTYFGEINLVEKSESSTSEIILELINTLKIKLDKDIATNLYYGIRSATRNFSSYSVTSQTLENAALLLKKNAVKKPLSFQQQTGYPKKQRPLEMIEKEKSTKEFIDEQELRPKISRPTSPRNLS
jgi:nanoRNase/pAp phosphatase (c-di-AMP/oligoRNAs hydrolase)